MPPPENVRKNALATAAVGGRDDISDLPDGVLQHILSFLPAQDAVRTCVLANRWRHLWKSTTVLRFVCGGKMEPKSMKEIQDFVDQLLRLRLSGGTPLDTFEFRLGETDDNDMSRIDIWIRIALQCKVRVLQLNCTCISHPIFISQYLKKLVLEGLDEEFIFRRDLKFCSSFNNLKSLLLNEYWCEPADFSALACLLKLCPVLEKLTLQLYSMGPKYKMEIKLNCNPLDISAEISRHLKIVEVKCQVYDERINNVLTFLTNQIFRRGQGSA